VVNFAGTAAGTEPIAYDWSFGDGSYGAGRTITHTYAATGTYVVVMTATNECGEEVVTDTITVVAEPVCTEVDIITITTVISECVVDFATDLYGDPPFTYLWHFGDGMTDTAAMPNHDYGASGSYSVTLEAWNCDGAGYDTETILVTVSCEPPITTYELYLPLIFKDYGP
jgi:PKD repeat protein